MSEPTLLTTILAFFLVLGPLVLVHELGHYLVGRWFGVKADAFSIGFGRELAGWTDRRGTRWKVSALPLGGYVQFAGDMNPASAPDPAMDGLSVEERAHTFHAKPLWQRTLIVLAGPLTNLLCAVAIFAAFNLAYGKIVATPEVATFTEASSARDAGLKIGDRILAVDGQAVENFIEIPKYILPYPGRTVTLAVRRDGRELEIPVRVAETIERDRFGNESRIGRIGIGTGKVEVVRLGFAESVGLGVEQSVGIMKMMVSGIGQIFTGERSVKELGGPIKIAKFSGEQFSLGWAQFVSFAALISINLAFINLLPIPGLDGGHLAFYAAEAVRRKPLDLRSQEWALRTGIALVLALMLFVTINDLATLPVFGG
ncbi:MAG TPA: RIP metalloprotease RseP [Novosphingobium sp.]